MTISARTASAVLLALLAGLPAAAELSAAEARGRAIYFGEEGSALDTATAEIGTMDVDLPASSFPCASCHGERGIGRAERGVVPSDLSRDALTRPYDVKAAAGRVRPPYTEDLFRRALNEGVDSGGTGLNEAMPRFDLSEDDVSDLWAFLDKLRQENDPGLGDEQIRVAVALPLSGASSATGPSMFAVADALAAAVNANGGVHGRALVLVPYDREVDAPPADVFAVLGASEPVAGVPTISPSFSEAPGHFAYSLMGGRDEQVAALRAFAIQSLGVTHITDVICGTPAEGGIALLGDPACNSDSASAERLLVPFDVFSQVPAEARAVWPDEVWVALPIDFSRISEGAQASFARIRATAKVRPVAPIAEAEIYSAGVLAVEALMRSGRGVTRTRFGEQIEAIQGFVGAMTPPLSYSANDHVGANGAYIVSYDVALGRLSAEGLWIDPAREGH